MHIGVLGYLMKKLRVLLTNRDFLLPFVGDVIPNISNRMVPGNTDGYDDFKTMLTTMMMMMMTTTTTTTMMMMMMMVKIMLMMMTMMGMLLW